MTLPTHQNPFFLALRARVVQDDGAVAEQMRGWWVAVNNPYTGKDDDDLFLRETLGELQRDLNGKNLSKKRRDYRNLRPEGPEVWMIADRFMGKIPDGREGLMLKVEREAPVSAEDFDNLVSGMLEPLFGRLGPFFIELDRVNVETILYVASDPFEESSFADLPSVDDHWSMSESQANLMACEGMLRARMEQSDFGNALPEATGPIRPFPGPRL
jgi:hypothetical protein